MNSRCLLLSLAAIAAFVVCAQAEEPGFHESLFNGKNLDGWKALGCEAAAENESLALKNGDGMVHSAYRYGDFILELDWKARKPSEYDSGIYIRAELPPPGKPFPTRYQINLKQGAEGNLVGVPAATSSGLVKPGEWNHFKISVVGKTAELEINGKPAWKIDSLENPDGFIGFQSEVKLGGQFEFRHIEITELGFKPLFNGRDLTGWQGATTGYFVENGVLVSNKEAGGDLFTTDEYRDFAVRFEFKLEAGANNGLGIHAPLEGKGTVAYRGIEIQILDDSDPQYKDLHPYQFHGSVYGTVPAKVGHLNPVGEWNYEEVICKGHQITVNLNGTTIVDADIEKASTPSTIDGLEHPGLQRTTGYIGLLGHLSRVEFRNIRVKRLNAAQ